MSNILSHPGQDIINQFAAGELPEALSIAVAAHIDLCPACADQLKLAEQALAEQTLGDAAPIDLTVDAKTEALPPELMDMLGSILSESPQSQAELTAESLKQLDQGEWQVNYCGRDYELPRALGKLLQQQLHWQQMGKFHRSRLQQSDSWRTSLLYIEPGGQTPEHTHTGREATLVLDGKFVDQGITYGPGDFIFRDAQHKHSPSAPADTSCLCLTAVEAPLHFTKGAARLLNPIAKLLY